jgi:quinol monooxygenase YgiN
MYGTIARVKIDPQRLDVFKSYGQRLPLAPGQLGRLIYQADADAEELYLVAIFASEQAYRANAQSPEQHERYLEMRSYLAADPEWHDGQIIDAVLSDAISVH